MKAIETSKKNISILLLFMLAAGLFLYSYLSVYNRYWADDWCYNADFYESGLWGTIKGYSYITTYASNRYSLTLFSGLMYPLGILGLQFFSVASIFTWAWGLYWISNSVRKLFQFHLDTTSSLALIFASIYFSLYMAPHLYQSLYWRSGSLPYLAPIIMSILLLGVMLHYGTLGKPSRWYLLLISMLAFFSGGFSEAGAATLVTFLTIYLVLAFLNKNQPWAKKTTIIAFIALFFSLLSMVVLIISPAIALRGGVYGHFADIMELPEKVISFSFDFVKFSLMGALYPHAAIIGIAFFLGHSAPNTTLPKSTKPIMNVFLVPFIILIIAFILIAASFAPSAYVEKAPPAPRTQIIPRFIMTFSLILTFWYIGNYFKKFSNHLLSYSLIAGGAFLMLYLGYTLKNVADLVPTYSNRAALWDERASYIETYIDNDFNQVYVKGIDGLPIGGIRDFVSEGHTGYWINKCAARVYELDAIRIGAQDDSND